MPSSARAPSRSRRRWLDPRALLSLPAVYRLQGGLLSPRIHAIFARDYMHVRPGDRVLDIGCAGADLLAHLPEEIEYVGFDESAAYVRAAEARFGHRATVHCLRADRRTLDRLGPAPFDLVVAHGVLHHLDDDEARELFALARAALKPDGRLVTADGCYVPQQSRVARFMLAHDRGRHVRTADAYQRLAREQFSSIAKSIRDDVARLPYTMIYLTCRA